MRAPHAPPCYLWHLDSNARRTFVPAVVRAESTYALIREHWEIDLCLDHLKGLPVQWPWRVTRRWPMDTAIGILHREHVVLDRIKAGAKDAGLFGEAVTNAAKLKAILSGESPAPAPAS